MITHDSGRSDFSIVICTRNPREEFFRKVLAAIAAHPRDLLLEVVVVDSYSNPPLATQNIAWPPDATIVRMDAPGTSRARTAGIKAARGEWIIFVDDDNVLDPDYLTRATEVIRAHPAIVLFCGRISGVFESPPPGWLQRFHRQLAIIDFPHDTWAHSWEPEKVPCWTAGMCVRRDIAISHCDHIQDDSFTISISRVEDVYLVMHTVAKGHGAGLFKALHLQHLVPKERMTAKYLSTIAKTTGYNLTVLRCRRQSQSGGLSSQCAALRRAAAVGGVDDADEP